MPQCPFCHRDNPAGVDHCQGCGAWLRSDTASPKIEPEAPASAALSAGQSPPELNPLDSQLLSLLRAGRKVEAVRICRQQMGCGLKEAKDYVELLAARHGVTASGAGCSCSTSAAILLLLIGIALGVVRWVLAR